VEDPHLPRPGEQAADQQKGCRGEVPGDGRIEWGEMRRWPAYGVPQAGTDQVGAAGAQHALGVIAGRARLAYLGKALGVEPG